MTIEIQSLVRLARHAVDQAARYLRTRPVQQIMAKGDRDLVTDLDLAIERRIREFLRQHTPTIGFFGEEEGGSVEDSPRWVLDAIDGTVNLVHGLPLYGISLALCDGTQPVLGVISLPVLRRTYWAATGLGAWRNGRPISSSTVHRLPDAMIAIGDYGTGDDADQRNQVGVAVHAALASLAGKVRMLGSAAVDLALVADGTLDASITLGNRSWDMAAGVAIARAAGATITDTDGSPHDSRSRTTIAAAPDLIGPVLKILRSATIGTQYSAEGAQQC